MSNKHKHYDLLVAWAGGAKVEAQDRFDKSRWTKLMMFPIWDPDQVYRVKPKPKVKRYFWIIKTKGGYNISSMRYSEDDVKGAAGFIQKIDDSMVEVEE